jgi:hypothetical protein
MILSTMQVTIGQCPKLSFHSHLPISSTMVRIVSNYSMALAPGNDSYSKLYKDHVQMDLSHLSLLMNGMFCPSAME